MVAGWLGGEAAGEGLGGLGWPWVALGGLGWPWVGKIKDQKGGLGLHSAVPAQQDQSLIQDHKPIFTSHVTRAT